MDCKRIVFSICLLLFSSACANANGTTISTFAKIKINPNVSRLANEVNLDLVGDRVNILVFENVDTTSLELPEEGYLYQLDLKSGSLDFVGGSHARRQVFHRINFPNQTTSVKKASLAEIRVNNSSELEHFSDGSNDSIIQFVLADDIISQHKFENTSVIDIAWANGQDKLALSIIDGGNPDLADTETYLYIFNFSKNEFQNVIATGNNAIFPVWSPNDLMIAYYTIWGIEVIDVQTGEQVVFSHRFAEYSERNPIWSLTEDYLLYEVVSRSELYSGSELRVVDVDCLRKNGESIRGEYSYALCELDYLAKIPSDLKWQVQEWTK